MTAGLPLLRRACTALAAVVVAAGCGHTESLRVASVPTLPPPTP
ncbi:ABC transporter substrate-binding protein, partial [Mycobacterium avium subsp. hominissuis]